MLEHVIRAFCCRALALRQQSEAAAAPEKTARTLLFARRAVLLSGANPRYLRELFDMPNQSIWFDVLLEMMRAWKGRGGAALLFAPRAMRASSRAFCRGGARRALKEDVRTCPNKM